MKIKSQPWWCSIAVGAGAAMLICATNPVARAEASVDVPSNELAASMQKLDAAWAASPLGFTDARFVEEPAAGYGAFEPRDGATFKPGDAINIYAEPVGYGYRAQDGVYEVELAVDFEILNNTGQVLAEQADFARVTAEARNPLREFQTSLSFRFEGLTDGDYILVTRFRDENSEKSGEIRLPFTIESEAAAE
ncbi:hypothetical protein HPQ64_19315 [Rhizobiales bacterium]|uniref:hypothetical protein n=1 Tax=Hongsoonwoonella zoysiae TaxID=2821844 RepID=UPI00155FD72B|nr:hypothetical protein [Hongsoonwoonella zoysiae]NRG19848.1 hypothetical protein [Hongsoonwoonella zoysiae]